MRKIRCLYVDDNSGERKRFERFLRVAWQVLRTDVLLELDVAISPDAARELFERTDYDLLLIDIMFGRVAAGLELIRDARLRLEDAAIVGISIKPEHREQALEVGADGFLSKSHTAQYDLKGVQFARTIRDALKAHNREYLLVEDVEVRYDERDLAVTADIEEIGTKQFAALVLQLLGRSCSRIDVERVRPGFSGSVVFRVLCQLRGAAGDPEEVRDILLKVSRERELLEREVKRWGSLAGFPAELFVTNLTASGISDVAGWYAVGSEFQQRAQTVHDWLVADSTAVHDVLVPDGQAVEKTLKWLFVDSGLPQVYDRQTEEDRLRPSEAILAILTKSRRARAMDSLDTLKKLASDYAGDAFDYELLRRLLTSNLIGNIDAASVDTGTRMCRCHGDLHTRNVLVGVHGHPRLIDPANIATLPVYSDLARFVTDLFISGWDAGDAAHDLRRVSAWCPIASQLVMNERVSALPGSSSAANARIAVALTWLTTNRDDIYIRGADEWQWLLALVVEFLRCSYRMDLPGPKRILALAAATIALRESQRQYLRGSSRSHK